MDRRRTDAVAVLTSTFPRSREDPAGRFLLDLLGALPYRFTVVCPRDPGQGPLDGDSLERRTFFNPGVFYGAGALGNLHAGGATPAGAGRVLVALAAMSAQGLRAATRARVVWTHWAVPAGAIGALSRLLLRRPHVLLLHSADVWLLERMPAGRVLARFIAWQTDRLFGVSEEIVERFARLSGRRGEVLSCGVEPGRAALRRGGEPAAVALLSRLVPSKGAAALAARAPELRGRLEIAGAGPEAGRVAALCARAPNARYRGPLVDEAKSGFLAAADVFAAPYGPSAWGQTEGLPVSVVEAMASGLPVVAFRSAVPAALIHHERSGLLVDDGDLDGFVVALNHLLDDPELRARLGRAAARRAEPLLLEPVARRWRSVFDRWLRPPP